MFDTQHKIKGLIGTVIFHIILIMLFIAFGLKYQDPPPETGVAIVFGFEEQGQGEIKPLKTVTTPAQDVVEEEVEEIEEQVQEESTAIEEKVEESDEEMMTQDNEESPISAVEKKNKELEEKKERERIERERIENERAEKERLERERLAKIQADKRKKLDNMFSGLTSDTESDNASNNSQGDDGVDGVKGSEDGNKDANSFYGNGGIGNSGNYQLGNRKPREKPKPIFDGSDSGIVVVRILVDQNGKVVYAEAGVKGSTTTDLQLLKRAKEAALKTTWQSDANAPEKQEGKIIYNFIIEQ